MLKTLFRFAILLMFLGCGRVSNKINPVFVKYYSMFSMTYAVSFETPIDLFDLDDSIAGECIGGEIRINHRIWDILPEEFRLELVFHELGHCVLGLGHDVGLRSDGCPMGIMYPINFGNPCLNLHWRDYLSGLHYVEIGDN